MRRHVVNLPTTTPPLMTTQAVKKWTMRQASAVLVSPARPRTPEQEHGSSADIERSEDGAASTIGKKLKRSRWNRSLAAIFAQPASLQSRSPSAAGGAHQPSPIAESPARDAATYEEETITLEDDDGGRWSIEGAVADSDSK